MPTRDHRQNFYNVWTVFTDASISFLIIILLVFVANTVRLNKVLREKEELAKFAETALADKREIVRRLLNNPDLEKMVSIVNGDTLVTIPQELIWKVNGHYRIDQLAPGAIVTIEKFGKELKKFLDEPDRRDPTKLRRDSYTILIIGHANTDGVRYSNYSLSKERAESVRGHLFEKVFNNSKDQENYTILATGVGDYHLVDPNRENKFAGERCIEVSLKYDDLDMVKGTKVAVNTPKQVMPPTSR